MTVTGVVDRAKATEVSGALRGLVAGGATEVVVDLTYACDGAALLTVLARTRADLVDRGGTLSLVGVAVPEFLPVLVSAPLEEVFLVYDAVRRDTGGARAGSGRTYGAGTGSARRRSSWPHPSRTATNRFRALQAVSDWWTAPESGGAHRA